MTPTAATTAADMLQARVDDRELLTLDEMQELAEFLRGLDAPIRCLDTIVQESADREYSTVIQGRRHGHLLVIEGSRQWSAGL
jgi:hypothetical protein